MKSIAPNVRALLKDAATKLTGRKKREFLAKTALEYCDGSARKTETYFGWDRDAVQLGLHELRSGIECIGNYWASGNQKTEAKIVGLEDDIRALVDGESQADPQMRTTLAYTRVTAQGVYQWLLEEKGYTDEELPTVRTINAMLNRMGYRLRSVQKTKPQKKSLKRTPFLPM